ncbi:hypothetical protein DM860_009055 [Cuscuta australis]|uniref:F-box domain-containing protein n=1 Tax=Cuscuta australis TaxID=267555 RepID=A0A328DD92_9ASTE|nr:hypothetical protein DM860_009055 [Cuscuta australis]
MAEDNRGKRINNFCCLINDNTDVLIEILRRLDGRSMAVAACVCRLWCAISRNDSLWENLCFRRLSPPPDGVREVVRALGGYRRLYMVCVRPVLSRLGRRQRRAWTTRNEVELSLSLFCVDYYERVLLLGENDGGSPAAPSSSLTFLCKEVNV